MKIEIIKNKIKSLSRINFIKDTAILQVSTILNSGLSILTSIILARLLLPDLYGQYSLIFALVGLVGMFMDIGVGYGTTTLLAEAYHEKNRQKIKNIITYFIQTTFLISLVIGGLAIIFTPRLADILYHNQKIGQLARLIILALIVGNFFNLLDIILQVIRKIKSLALLENFNKLAYFVFPVTLVLLHLSLVGVVFGHFLAATLFFFISLFIYRTLARRVELLPSLREIFGNFFQFKTGYYLKFGILIAVDKNLSKLYTLIPLTLLGMFAATKDVGFFKIAYSYMSIPLVILGPVSRLLMVQLPKDRVNDIARLNYNFRKVTLYTGLLAALLVVPFIVLAPFLVKLFYGASYRPVTGLTTILALYTIANGFAVGVSPIFRTLHKMKLGIKLHCLILFFTTPVVYYLIKNYKALGAVWATIIFNIVPIIVFLVVINFILKKENKAN